MIIASGVTGDPQRRLGIRWVFFRIKWKSCISTGPRGPAVNEFWLSATGIPAAVVRSLLSRIVISGDELSVWPCVSSIQTTDVRLHCLHRLLTALRDLDSLRQGRYR